MWWCCGKTHKDAPGCKFAKHLSRDEEEEEREAEFAERSRFEKKRCDCCKGVGHLGSFCDRDPNVRTGEDLEKEILRIEKN